MAEWGADAVHRELAAVTKGFDIALAGLAEAADYAQRAAGRMAAGGLRGVAGGIGQIRRAIDTNHDEVADLAARVPPLMRAVKKVGGDTVPQHVVAALIPVVDELGRLSGDTLHTANRKLVDTEVLIRRLLAGGSPEQLQARVGGARSVLRAVHDRLNRAAAISDSILATAREAGKAGSAGGGGQDPSGGTLRVPTRAADEPEQGHPGHQGTSPSPFDPVPHLNDMPRFEKRPGHRPKTHGRWTDPNGVTHALVSGKATGTTGGATMADPDFVRIKDWARQRGLVPAEGELAVAADVEMKFCAHMRRHDIRHATITINNPQGPCPGDYGCDALIEQVLSVGTSLTVYWPGNHKTYYGKATT